MWLLFLLAAHSELSSLLLREPSPTPIQPVPTGSTSPRDPCTHRSPGHGALVATSGSGNTGWFSQQCTTHQARLLFERLHVHALSPRESSTSASHLHCHRHQPVTPCGASCRKCMHGSARSCRMRCDRVAFKCSESYHSPSPWLAYLQLNMSEQQHSKLFFKIYFILIGVFMSV